MFPAGNTNSFPSAFAVLLIAFYQLIIGESRVVSNYDGLKAQLKGLSKHIATGRVASSADDRLTNVNAIKGVIGQFFVPCKDTTKKIYGNHNSVDIDAIIRRSDIELASYELKQGLLKLTEGGGIDANVLAKIINTICAIANNGPESSGKIIIGVTDKDSDADRVMQIDAITPRKVGRKYVVGVDREARRIGISLEKYVSKIRDAIKQSGLSDNLKMSCLSNIDYNSYYGLGVIIISIPPQKELSLVGENIHWRSNDSTETATGAKQIASIAQRFSIKS